MELESRLMNKYATQACRLGESFHEAFRKATTCKQAGEIWNLIDNMPHEDWLAVEDYVYANMPRRVKEAMDEEGKAYAERHDLA